jgi:hypothetical protein
MRFCPLGTPSVIQPIVPAPDDDDEDDDRWVWSSRRNEKIKYFDILYALISINSEQYEALLIWDTQYDTIEILGLKEAIIFS